MNVATISLPGGGTVSEVSLSERLQWILDHRSISASALSLKAGQSRAYVRKLMEREPVRPDFSALERIAEVAEVPPLWLIRGTGSPTDSAVPLPPRPEIQVIREDSRIPEDDEVPLETALFAVFAARRKDYTTADFDAARASIRAAHRKTHPNADLDGHARQLLDAAKQLRVEGVPVNPTNLAMRVAAGKTQRGAEVVREVSDAYNAEADESLRAQGLEPDAGKGELQARIAARNAKKEKRGQ